MPHLTDQPDSLFQEAHSRAEFDAAVAEKYAEHAHAIYCRTDVMFAILMQLQWIACVFAAGYISPRTWIGEQSLVHPHMVFAVFVGGLLAAFPTMLAVTRPGRLSTRMVIAVSQVMFSSLLIHLTGGRIETHFHVFASLAFLAAYRDWRVLVPATLIVAVDHLARGYWWPATVFGVATASEWRWLEHAGWVLFEDVLLALIIAQSTREMRALAHHTTEVEWAMALAKESEGRFRGSFAQAAVGMGHCALDGRWLRVNETLCKIVGYSREELLERSFQNITHPDDLGADLREVERLLAGETTHYTREKRYFHKRGHIVWIKLSVSLMRRDDGEPDYFIGVIEDISEAKAAKEALLSSHEEIRKLSLVASKGRHAIVIADDEGRAELANQAFTEITEFSLNALVGQKPWQLLSGRETDPGVLRFLDEREAAMQSATAELLAYSRNGRKLWVALELDPVFDESGGLTNFITTLSDITERKTHEAQLRTAMQQAESANRAKSQFLANMSHEIRTPLNGILGFTDLLLRDEAIGEVERREYLHTISTSGKHLLMLINDVLDLSKIEAGQLQVDLARCSPHQIIAEVISVLRVRAEEKGISLEYRWESGIPDTIETDAHRLKQLLMNLVGNAVKFTDQGRVLVVAAIGDQAGRHNLTIEVRDTGIGIPRDKLTTIFDPFVQADNSVTRKYGGTGLGLSISRNIAEALGGRISATSEIGAGSTFALTIATGDLQGVRMLSRPPEADSGDIAKRESKTIRLDGIRVLLVDDGDTNRRLIRIRLSRCGAEVVTAENGQVAIDIMGEQPFDIVLMDMQMPVLDGYAATAKLREMGFTLPIVALTAHAMKGDREKCERAGCSGYLPKPIDVDQLLRAIVAAVGAPAPAPMAASATEALTSVTPAGTAIRSLLPTDDLELRSVVCEFIDTLSLKLGELETAADQQQHVEVARLAHWLKGAGGTVGFDCFTAPAAKLEKLARDGRQQEIVEVIHELQSLGERVCV